MNLQLQTFASLLLVLAVKSMAEDFALFDPEHGISSVEILEDNIANLESPDMIEILAQLKPVNKNLKPERVEEKSKDESGKKPGKPFDESKTEFKVKKISNGDKLKNTNMKPDQDHPKVSKSKQKQEKPEDSKEKTPGKDGKNGDSDATKSESGDDTKWVDVKQEKSKKKFKNSKSKDENTKTKDNDSKIDSEHRTKDGTSSKKPTDKNTKKTNGDNEGKSDNNPKTDSDVIDDKEKKDKDKSEGGGQSSDEDKFKEDEEKKVEKPSKLPGEENGGNRNTSKEDSKKVDENSKKSKPIKSKKVNKQTVSDVNKSSHDHSKDSVDSKSKKSSKKQKKDSKKNKNKAKSQKKKSMTEMEKAREGATTSSKPDKTSKGDSKKSDSRSHSPDSLKHICDVIDAGESEPASDDAYAFSAMRAFVPIVTNKPEQDKSRRKKKKKTAIKSKLLFGCEDAKPKDITKYDGQGGITTIYSQASKTRITIYCDNTTLGGGWTVFQRRVDGKLDFDRGYGAYQRGFGELSGEHWLGLDVMANITGKDKYELRLEMTDADGKKMIANYGEFSIGSQAKGYRLRVGDFDGIRVKDVLASYNGQRFSTFNQDETKSQCGSRLQSGFWFDNCSTSSPNGKYFISPFKSRRPSGIPWKPIPGKFGPITQIEMKFRKK